MVQSVRVEREFKEQLTTLTEETGIDIATTKRSLEDPEKFITPGQTPNTSNRKPFTNA